MIWIALAIYNIWQYSETGDIISGVGAWACVLGFAIEKAARRIERKIDRADK